MINILITGGTGTVGTTLTRMLLQQQYKVTILTRSLHRDKQLPNVEYALWDVEKRTIDTKALQSAHVIIHLAGAGVMDHKWTNAYKQEIIDSRVKGLDLIVDELQKIKHQVNTLISASAIGWYGGNNDAPYKEELPAASGFLGETCQLWEAAADRAMEAGIRVVKLRTGIVLAQEGGAYPEFKTSLKFGVAAVLGNGSQVVSWIDIEDLCSMYVYLIQHQQFSGAFNAVAPAPVSNKTLTLTIAKLLRKQFYIAMHVPSFILKMMFGERSIEILKSADVSSEKIKKTGFTFLYPSIETSVKHLEKL